MSRLKSSPLNQSLTALVACAALLVGSNAHVEAEDDKTNPDSRDRSTAVALNYCARRFTAFDKTLRNE